MLIDTDQWKLSIRIEYVPKNPDTKVSCWACRGRGVDILFGETQCPECGGNGFRYTRNTTEPKPEVSKEIWEHIRKAYLELKELA